MYTIKVYVRDRHCNMLHVDDWKVVKENASTYVLMTRSPEFFGWESQLYVCRDWGFKVFDENDNLVCFMGQVDDNWVQPYVTRSSNVSHVADSYDEYADQPDAL